MKKVTTQLRKTLLMLCLNAISVIGLSQDTIYKNDGNMIIAKISEIQSDAVSYHRFDFQDGPMYVVKKSEVKSISFSSGLKETFEKPAEEYVEQKQKPVLDLRAVKPAIQFSNKLESFGSPYRFRYQGVPVNEKEMQRMLLALNDASINAQIKKSKKCKGLQYLGFGIFPLGIAAIAIAADGSNNDSDAEEVLGALVGVAGIACPIASGIFKHNRGNANTEAVRLYNQKYQ